MILLQNVVPFYDFIAMIIDCKSALNQVSNENCKFLDCYQKVVRYKAINILFFLFACLLDQIRK